MQNLIWLLLLIGCGDDKGNNETESKEDITTLQSIALKSKHDLPECLESNETQLAYVKDEKVFYVCEKGDWLAIDLEVKSEIKTVVGAKGDDGSDGETVTTNNWYDSVTGKYWLIGSNNTYDNAFAGCISPWRLPGKNEALAAAQRGLGVAASTINGPTTMWTSEVWDQNATHNVIITAINTTPANSVASRLDGSTKGTVCIHE